MPLRPFAMRAGAVALSLAIASMAASAPVDSSTIVTGVADITHVGCYDGYGNYGSSSNNGCISLDAYGCEE